MPTIYDNIDKNILDGLKIALTANGAERADICVGYFNLRGWKCIADSINALPGGGEEIPPCRLIVGMRTDADRTARNFYHNVDEEPTNQVVNERRKELAASLARQLTYGTPTANDESGLHKLIKQLRGGKLKVSFFGEHPLHAKLYLAHRKDKISPIIGFVGSSNLTFSGMQKQGELNVDVLDKDAAEKLQRWFEERWQSRWCLDITEELADIIENSWAGGAIKPYEIYIKTAYELSKEAIAGTYEFKVPREFNKIMLEFQKQAVSLAAERLNRRGGVIIGDVVGLGKTLVASAVAKTFQQDRGDSVLVICPPKLEGMWKDYLHDYQIAGDTLSLGQFNQLENMRRFRLVIIDESHNLRNRETRRYAAIRDYISKNDSRVVLLSATPYNKQFTDISSQLRLFFDPDADIGIRPEGYIKSLDGIDAFKQKHSNTPVASLAAFDHSEKVDDWRELMRMFMVRRTRSHIVKNYAEYDEGRNQHYLIINDGERFYFPKRESKCAKFSLDDKKKDDQYALLYSKSVVDTIGELKLPRYGIGQYLLPEYQEDPPNTELSNEEKRIIKNLSRSGTRLIGFAKSGLFKRLESSGPAFLLSIKRHIIRNAIYLAALENEKEFPIGDVFGALIDESIEEDEDDIFSAEMDEENEIKQFLQAGRNVYQRLLSPSENFTGKFDWIRSQMFDPELGNDLLNDCEELLKVLNKTPEWDDATDRKLGALEKLCNETHAGEKILVFTQFKDTADYLHEKLQERSVDRIAKVFGNMDDISTQVNRFSPTSNKQPASTIDELRVLITTDTLSEGQNLQDAHIIVNFDLPWAIIRLVQRAGRVDRIGQKSPVIFCYCFLPEEGIDRIISLRGRLQNRLRKNAELIGTDEVFFEGDIVNLKEMYKGTLSMEDEDEDTDLVSRAYDIWRQATKDNDELKARIENLPDVVYSAKRLQEKQAEEKQSAIAYIKTTHNHHILAQINDDCEIISQSQSKILNLLECESEESAATSADNHHKLIAAAVKHVKDGRSELGGQLGGVRNIRSRVYEKLRGIVDRKERTVFESDTLKKAADQIYQHPLTETARDRFRRALRTQIDDDGFEHMVRDFYENKNLCAIRKDGDPIEPHIICSMGLIE